ncbi:SUMO ligase siz1 [Irineochytrium annulatum]|nr:SUMO ligase siz1 [Irineochytrium annulatum]
MSATHTPQHPLPVRPMPMSGPAVLAAGSSLGTAAGRAAQPQGTGSRDPAQDRIHELSDADFSALANLVGFDPTAMRGYLKNSTAINRMTIAKIRAVFHHLCDRFGQPRTTYYLKEQWVNGLTSLLYSSSTRSPSKPTTSPFGVKLNFSTPNPASSSAFLTARAPAVPPKASELAGAEIKGWKVQNPQNMPGAGFGLTEPVGSERGEKMSFAEMLKVESAMKLFPPSFHLFHDFMDFITFREMSRFNNPLNVPFRILARHVPSFTTEPRDSRTRCYLAISSEAYVQPATVSVFVDNVAINLVDGKPKANVYKRLMVVDITANIKSVLKGDAGAVTSGRRFNVSIAPKIKMNNEVVVVVMMCEKLDMDQCAAKFYDITLKAKNKELTNISVDDPVVHNPLNGIHLFPGFSRYGGAANGTERDLSALEMTLLALPSTAPSSSQQDAAKAAGGGEDDIEMGDTTVSFQCPLLLGRIKHPAKGARCRHAQVFDAISFLQCMETSDVWKCIVCNKPIAATELTLDLKFLGLLKKYEKADRCVIRADGTDAPFEEPKPEPPKPTIHPAEAATAVADSGSSQIGATSSKNGGSASKRSRSTAESEVICIDSDGEVENIPSTADSAGKASRRERKRARLAEKKAREAAKVSALRMEGDVIVLSD